MTEYTKADKVKLQEVIDALKNAGFWWTKELALKIEQHGIEVPYTPMTDDEIYDLPIYMLLDDTTTTVRKIEQAVLARLGVAPTIDQAKQICEQAGFAVVPREPTIQATKESE